jgi:hypothetical protein
VGSRLEEVVTVAELEVARRLPGTAGCAAIRDIPASCTCTGWLYKTAPPRWVLGRRGPACPWHTAATQ